MFCSKCGKKLQDDVSFCPACGNKVGENAPAVSQPVKVMLDPAEAMPEKKVYDSSKSFGGQGKTLGLILIIVSIILDLIGIFFFPFFILGTVFFVVGILMRMFCP